MIVFSLLNSVFTSPQNMITEILIDHKMRSPILVLQLSIIIDTRAASSTTLLMISVSLTDVQIILTPRITSHM